LSTFKSLTEPDARLSLPKASNMSLYFSSPVHCNAVSANRSSYCAASENSLSVRAWWEHVRRFLGVD